MRKSILILVSILLFAVVVSGCAPALAAQAQATQTPSGTSVQPRTVSVNGTGKAYLDPDIAMIYVGVHTEAADATEAVAQNNEQSQKVSDALKALGIPVKDIQTTNFSIYPQQQYSPSGELQETRYAVDNTVFVTLRDLTKLGEVLDGVIAAGANSINGIQFDVADRTEALADARKAAVTDARSQAEELAAAAGVEIGEIQSLSTYNVGYPGPIFDGRGGAAAEAAASVPISPGQLIVSVDVTAVYEIR